MSGLRIVGGSGSHIPSSSGNRSSGGIYVGSAVTLVLVDSTVAGNSVTDPRDVYGAGINNDGNLRIVGSTISGNTIDSAWAYGGGIYDSGGATATLINSTVSGNVANGTSGSFGGGIDSGHLLRLTETTVAGYAALNGGGDGGGVRTDLTGTTTIGSSIVVGNTAATGPDCGGGNAVTAGYNVIGKGNGCASLINGSNGDQIGTVAQPLAAKLGPLVLNGGLTRTRTLLTGSPAIDAGGAGPCPRATDQRGTIRPQGSACDVGAVEVTTAP